MIQSSWKSLVFCVVLVAALFVTADNASAWWYGCCGPTPTYPAYSTWDGCGTGSWYLGYRPGPVRRLVFGPYRWYYAGYYPVYGNYYYSSCCYPTYTVSYCCGESTESEGTPVTNQQPTPVKKAKGGEPTTAPAPAPAPPAGLVPEQPTAPKSIPESPITPTSDATPDNSGVLTVWVPHDAKVTINGMVTKTTGSRRQFVSYNLKPGFSYKYEVQAEVVRDGKIVEDNKTVILTAGQNTAVAFGFNYTPNEAVAAQ